MLLSVTSQTWDTFVLLNHFMYFSKSWGKEGTKRNKSPNLCKFLILLGQTNNKKMQFQLSIYLSRKQSKLTGVRTKTNLLSYKVSEQRFNWWTMWSSGALFTLVNIMLAPPQKCAPSVWRTASIHCSWSRD